MFSVILPFAAYSQPGLPSAEIRDGSIVKEGDRVSVGFTAATGRFSGDYAVTLVPVLYDDCGNSAVLEPVTLAGRRGMISARRNGTAPEWNTVRVKGCTQYRYDSSVAWEPWMERVSLSVYRFGEGCGRNYEQVPLVAAAGISIYEPATAPQTPVSVPDVTPSATRPAVEPAGTVSADEFSRNNPFLLRRGRGNYADAIAMIGRETEGGSGRIYFQVGRSDLDPSLMDNAQALRLVDEALRVVEQDPTVELSRIFIVGFASPEGRSELNMSLAQGRAESVRNYLIHRAGITDMSLFEIHNGGEDWNGLRRMVESSDVPWRDKVLYLIDSRTEGDELVKSKLKYFEKGVPYAYMRKNFFPPLRSSNYILIYYNSAPAVAEPK